MRKLIYLIALTMIAVFTLVSCDPSAGISKYNWNAANEGRSADSGFDAAFTPEITYTSISSGGGTVSDIKLSITFNAAADIIKSSDIKNNLGFLTFHEFTTPDDFVAKGLASDLSQPIPYEFVEVSGTRTIILDLKKSFTGEYSNLIAKFDAKGYTIFNGLTRDRDNDGNFGEAIYDDTYVVIILPGSNNDAKYYWSEPGNKGWSFSLGALPSGASFADNATTTNTISYFKAATLSMGSVEDAIIKKIADSIASGIKLQKLTGETWEDVKTAAWDDTYKEISIKDVTFAHNTVYRLAWKGSANIKSADKYYLVEQKIRIDNDESNKLAYARTEWTSNAKRIVNGVLLREVENPPKKIEVFSMDSSYKNAVIRLEFDFMQLDGGGSFVGLEAISEALFNENFKLLINYEGDDFRNDDYTANLVKIEKFEYACEGQNPNGGGDNTSINNVIYLTIDKNVVVEDADFTFLLNDKFGYTGNTPKWVYGDLQAIAHGNFKHYEEYVETTLLVSGTQSTINLSYDDHHTKARFTFYVTEGRVYTFSASATNAQITNVIFPGMNTLSYNSGYSFSRSFVARASGTVIINTELNAGWLSAAPAYARFDDVTDQVIDYLGIMNTGEKVNFNNGGDLINRVYDTSSYSNGQYINLRSDVADSVDSTGGNDFALQSIINAKVWYFHNYNGGAGVTTLFNSATSYNGDSVYLAQYPSVIIVEFSVSDGSSTGEAAVLVAAGSSNPSNWPATPSTP